jgi:hypothetical protein
LEVGVGAHQTVRRVWQKLFNGKLRPIIAWKNKMKRSAQYWKIWKEMICFGAYSRFCCGMLTLPVFSAQVLSGELSPREVLSMPETERAPLEMQQVRRKNLEEMESSKILAPREKSTHVTTFLRGDFTTIERAGEEQPQPIGDFEGSQEG